jgi:hypothetical protein
MVQASPILIFQNARQERVLPELAPSFLFAVAEVSQGRSLHLSG